MAVSRMAFSLFKTGICTTHIKYGAMTCLVTARDISSLELSKNLELISKDKKNSKVTNLQLSDSQDKPVVILLSWLMAKRKHIYKFANYYIGNGFDVLNVSISPWQLLWPTKGSQVVADDILNFLEANPSYAPLVLHGFSVGAYLWGEVLVKMAQEEKRYAKIKERISGQIWDSAVDITELCVGVPIAVFPRNTVLQNALKQYLLYHLRTFDKVATCHYIRASQMFHTNLVQAPAQFFVSQTDPVGAERSNIRARDSWENTGIKVSWKCWKDSPHVGHYYRHPKEYIEELNTFLSSINLLECSQKVQMKV